VNQSKSAFYTLLEQQLTALLSVCRHRLTNLSQFTAFLNMHLEEINWVGFYLAENNEELLLGPFQGKVACTHIPMGKGVCGTAAARRESVVVADVDQFDGHIACDAASRSEIVIPLIVADQLLGVLDVDSPILNRFNNDDKLGLESLLEILKSSTDF
jgi:L-methionine (R)-S-oxide reductase